MTSDRPFLVVGGGIGGLAAGYALALKGFPVRIFEQAGEFREVGAGIQLGPNVFRALAHLGLKDVVLADAWRPGAQEMRCALSGKLITHTRSARSSSRVSASLMASPIATICTPPS